MKADKISWVGMHPDCKFAAVDTIHVFAPKSLDAIQVVNGGCTNSMDLVYPFRLCVILLMARLGKPSLEILSYLKQNLTFV